MKTNIYKIKTNELNDFISYNGTDKLIVFYKQGCPFCKMQIDCIRDIADKYKDRINCAICDVTGKTKFIINNSITGLPTIHIYKNNQLEYNHRSYIESNELEKQLNLFLK